MNNNGSSNFFAYLFMAAIGVIVGFICFSTMDYGSLWHLLILVFLNSAVVLSCYYLLRGSLSKKLRQNLMDVVKNVRKIADGEDFDVPKEDFFSNEISELYKTIEMLKKSLVAQNNSKDNVIGIINSIALNIELDRLLDDMLPKIIDGTKSNWGAFYLYNSQTEKMELKSSIGFTKNIYKEFDISLGEGFIGISAQTDDISIFDEIPDDTVYISKTFLGKIKPRSIMTVPIRSDGEIVSVLLLASIYDYNEEQIEIVKLIRYYMASAVANGLTYERTKRLKNELSFQNQLIQNMNEELEGKVELRTMFWSNIINSIVDYAIIAMDKDGYIIMWNKGAETIGGFSEKEVVGRHITEAYVDSTPNDVLECLKIAKKEGKFEDYGWMTKKDGSVIYAHRIVTAVHNEQGELTGYTTITRDITSNKLLEDRAAYFSYFYDLLVAGEQKGLIMLNDAGCMVNLSAKAADLCGRSIEELKGSSFDNLLENRKVFRQKLEACMSDLSREEWRDKLDLDGSVIDIDVSMMGIATPGSSEKVALLYINKAGES